MADANPKAGNFSPLVRRGRRVFRRHRRWFAAGLAAAATAFALQTLAPSAPPTRPVVVAHEDLNGGSTLTSADVRLVEWPVALAPPDALEVTADVEGRVLAGPMTAGEPITSVRILGPSLLASLGVDGLVATPVRLADAAASSLLRPGDRVDVLAASAGASDPIAATSGGPSAEVVASSALVVTVPAATGSSSLIGGSSDSSGLVLLAVTRTETLALARAAVLGPLSIVLVG